MSELTERLTRLEAALALLEHNMGGADKAAGVFRARRKEVDLPDVSGVPIGGVIGWWWDDLPTSGGTWVWCDGEDGTRDTRGRFPVGYDESEQDYDSVTKTGGFKLHGGDENDHDDHEVNLSHGHGLDSGDAVIAPSPGGASCFSSATYNIGDGPCGNPNTEWCSDEIDAGTGEYRLEHSETDNRPPWFVIKWIMRIA